MYASGLYYVSTLFLYMNVDPQFAVAHHFGSVYRQVFGHSKTQWSFGRTLWELIIRSTWVFSVGRFCFSKFAFLTAVLRVFQQKPHRLQVFAICIDHDVRFTFFTQIQKNSCARLINSSFSSWFRWLATAGFQKSVLECFSVVVFKAVHF